MIKSSFTINDFVYTHLQREHATDVERKLTQTRTNGTPRAERPHGRPVRAQLGPLPCKWTVMDPT
jgi:hypothetical protein